VCESGAKIGRRNLVKKKGRDGRKGKRKGKSKGTRGSPNP
jgi:hypothetical protein